MSQGEVIEVVEVAAPIIMDAAEARLLTDRVKVGLDGIWQIVVDVYQRRGWVALGYTAWDEYCRREFGTSHLQLPREDRHEVLPSMREHGLSLRAIASATGLSRGTVHRELAAVPNGTAAPSPSAEAYTEFGIDPAEPRYALTDDQHEQALTLARAAGDLSEAGVNGAAEQVLQDAAPAPVLGVDGKTYAPTQQQGPRRRSPLPDAWSTAVYRYRKATDRLQTLINDDRFPAYAATGDKAIYGPLQMSLAIAQDMESFLSQLGSLAHSARRGWYSTLTDDDFQVWELSEFLTELWSRRDAERRASG